MRSPVLGCAMRPFTWLAGHWAYVVVQCAVTAFAVVLLWSRVLKRRGTLPLGAALLLSGVGLFAGWVMADVWTLTGLIGLFVVAGRVSTRPRPCWRPLPAAAHFGNFPVLAVTAVAMLPWVRRPGALRGPAVPVRGRGGPLRRGGQPVRRHAQVQLRQRVCLSRRARAARHAGGARPQVRRVPGLPAVRSAGGGAPLERREPPVVHLGRRRASRAFLGGLQPHVPGADRRRPAHAAAALPGTCVGHGAEHLAPDALARSCRTGSRPSARTPSWRRICASPSPKTCAPTSPRPRRAGRSSACSKSWTCRLSLLVWLSTALCLVCRRRPPAEAGADPLVLLALFALVAVAVNALFMSNLSGVFGRYQARIEFLLVFPARGRLSWMGASQMATGGQPPPS